MLAAYRLATEAESIADEVLAGLKQEAERRAQAADLLAAQLQVAEASYNRAADYIAARHGAIGRDARTRLIEAERHLDRARELASADPRPAVSEARRAQQLADDAYQLAQRDFDDYDRYGGDVFARSRWGGVLPIPIPIGSGWGGGGWGGSP